jgi:hypothetical protein
MRFIGKAIEEHKTCEGIAFEEWVFEEWGLYNESEARMIKLFSNQLLHTCRPSHGAIATVDT